MNMYFPSPDEIERLDKLVGRLVSRDLAIIPTAVVRQKVILTSVFRAALEFIRSSRNTPRIAVMNSRTYIHFRQYSRDNLEIVTGGSRKGSLGSFDGVHLFTKKDIPVGEVWILVEEDPETVYGMSVDVT